jgi:hypothetical protein
MNTNLINKQPPVKSSQQLLDQLLNEILNRMASDLDGARIIPANEETPAGARLTESPSLQGEGVSGV